MQKEKRRTKADRKSTGRRGGQGGSSRITRIRAGKGEGEGEGKGRRSPQKTSNRRIHLFIDHRVSSRYEPFGKHQPLSDERELVKIRRKLHDAGAYPPSYARERANGRTNGWTDGRRIPSYSLVLFLSPSLLVVSRQVRRRERQRTRDRERERGKREAKIERKRCESRRSLTAFR